MLPLITIVGRVASVTRVARVVRVANVARDGSVPKVARIAGVAWVARVARVACVASVAPNEWTKQTRVQNTPHYLLDYNHCTKLNPGTVAGLRAFALDSLYIYSLYMI